MKTIEFYNSFINIANKQGNTFAKIFSKPDMQSRLIVKNFGPIKEVDLDLRNVNVFIGPQASGKSALAKIYTIFKAPRKFFKEFDGNSETEIENNKKVFLDVLEEYNIKAFLQHSSEIYFESELHTIKYKNGLIEYTPNLYQQIKELDSLHEQFDNNKEAIISKFTEIGDKFIYFKIRAFNLLKKDGQKFARDKEKVYVQSLNKENCLEVITIIKDIEETLSTNAALYIPAERTFINIIKNASLNLLKHNVPIPKHILSFGAELEKIGIKEINLEFITKGLTYKNVNGEDKIYFGENKNIKLTEAASGVQSVVPILIPILAQENNIFHRSFVIEELELNIFPSAQYKLLQDLESRRTDAIWEDFGTIHTYTTHSPYVLSALNNLLYANKIRRSYLHNDNPQKHEEIQQKIKQIVKADINPYYFTAYQLSNGTAESIFDRNLGLITENFIDESTDEINQDFEALMELANDNAPTD